MRCGTLFAGDETATRSNATLGFGEDGTITFVCDTADAPPVSMHDTVLDYSGLFVLPGLLYVGKRMQIPDHGYDPRQVTDRSLANWTDLYTQGRVRVLYPSRKHLTAADRAAASTRVSSKYPP